MRSDNLETETKSWTDDLPSCSDTGAGYSTNQIYKENGVRIEIHKSRDKKCYCKIDDNISLYGVFSGHYGSKVAEFALQKMAADILLGQLNGKTTDEEIKDVLRQAFVSVEKGYFDSIDGLIAQKTMLQYEIPDGVNQYEITQKYQHILDQLNSINLELSVGCSVVIALIYNSKLYIGNVGNCRALLCKNDANNVLRVIQLSVDHNLYNEDEVLRLCQLGLDISNLKQAQDFSTRCIGNYLGKTGYKDCDFLSGAQSEPVTSQPELVGPITIDQSCRFLLLMSGGLCKSLHEVFSSDLSTVNKEIVQMAVEQFRSQSTLTGVSQSIVHKIVQLHHDTYMQQQQDINKGTFNSRDDVTLLVRNFNYPIPNAIHKRTSQARSVDTETSSIMTNDSQYTNTNSSSSSSGRVDNGKIFDKNAKVKPYVDFTEYFQNVEAARKNKTLPPDIDFD